MSNTHYFNQDTEQAVIQFQQATTQKDRDEVWNQHLQAPLHKLAECIYHKVKPSYVHESEEDAIKGCLSHLQDVIGRFDSAKGKAYSFLTRCAYTHFQGANIAGYNNDQRNISVELYSSSGDEEFFPTPTELRHYDHAEIDWQEYMTQLTAYIQANASTVIPSKSNAMQSFNIYLLQVMEHPEDVEYVNCKTKGTQDLYRHIRKLGFKHSSNDVAKLIRWIKDTHQLKIKEYVEYGAIK